MTTTNLSVVPERSRVTRLAPVRDLEAATKAAREFLRSLGIDPDDPATPDLAETPRRLALAYAELLDVPEFDFTTFANAEGYDELVLVREIPFQSVCEHHLLPFTGTAHIGYLPRGRIVGLSKLARTVDHFARRPQTQERLTMQVEDPIRYEKIFSRLRGGMVNARETALNISASPIVKEIGELCFALYTPEGDSIALSTGIIAHVHTMSDAIKVHHPQRL